MPGTLLPGETTYPSDLQLLVNRLASVLFTPEQPRDFYRHTSPDQAPGDSLWLDQRSGALKAQNSSSVWKTILAGNFSYIVSPTNGSVAPNTSLFNPAVAPIAGNGKDILSFGTKPYLAGNRILVFAHIPGVTASENDVTVYGTLVCGSVVFGIATTTVRIGELNSMLVLGVHTPAVSDYNAAGEVVYRLRLGTDDADAQVYYNRKIDTDAFQNFMKITMLAIEVPSFQ